MGCTRYSYQIHEREKIIIQTKIMTSVMVKISSKILVIVMIAAILMVVMSMPLTFIPSSSTTQHPVPVSIVRPLREHLSQGDKFYHRAEDDLEDYNFWKPSPACGGGGGSPIPHPQEKSY